MRHARIQRKRATDSARIIVLSRRAKRIRLAAAISPSALMVTVAVLALLIGFVVAGIARS